ncbi:MAG: ribbon-helix-helix domain-containing protein [Rhodospirillales bacterium]|jgi:predicted DNA-binding ribbon-helix-helix protein|nr:ribbon-helix-helix domain-containing protein [Rhodospirillales bacterium]
MSGILVSRNVTVAGHRTSIRLEGATWSALDQICEIEDKTVHELCTLIESIRMGSSRTAFVRAFIITYFHSVANASGNLKSGTMSSVLETASSRIQKQLQDA